MKWLTARTRITFGLACLLLSILCTAMMLGMIPENRTAKMEGRATLCESVAMSGSDYVGRSELRRFEHLLGEMVDRQPDVLSAGVRRADGRLQIVVGPHAQLWRQTESERSTDTHVRVPIRSGRDRWGTVELRFRPLREATWAAYFSSPWVRMTLFVTATCYLLFFVYLGKMLQHLDPSKAVPKRVRAALDSLAEGLLVIDREGRIVLANQAFSDWVRQTPEKMIGVRAATLNWMRNQSGDPIETFPWEQAIEQEQAQAGVMIGLADDKEGMRVLMANASPVLGHDGKYRGVLVSFDDVTQLEETKKDLEAAKEIAEDANQAKSEFLARMSHEIRTPMNAILGYTDVLRRGFDENVQDRFEYLNTIHSSGEHLLSLINDILDLSKIESGQMELELQPCSPHRIVSQVAALLKSRADEKDISLNCEFPQNLPATVLADPVRLRQMVLNLTGNAIKFTEKGGVRIVVHLDQDSAADAPFIIDVIDSGIGISEEAQKKIFDPFSQADTSITRRFGGTGLGLAICVQLAESMGGGVSVSSEPGKGSTFRLRFDPGPLDDSSFVDAETAREAAAPRQSPTTPAVQLPPARILVADDGPSNCKLVRLVLERAGAKVVTVENGQLALDEAAVTQFDAILMDMQMPVMDGYTATRELRNRGYDRQIIALTAHAMQGDEDKCRAAGCSGFLTKPIDLDVLLAVVAEALGDVPTAAGDPCDAEQEIQETVGELVSDARRAARDTNHDANTDEESQPLDSGPVVCSYPLDDPDFLEIAELFVPHLKERIEEMRAACSDQDFEELGLLGHWLKGSGGSAGFNVFYDPARRLEEAAKATDLPDCVRQVDLIAGLADRIDLTAGVTG